MKQLTTTLNGKELMLIEIPEGITGEGMHVDTGTLFWSSEVNMPFTGWDCHFDPAPVIPDEFKLLGLASDIPEEVWAAILEKDLSDSTRYKNYIDPENSFESAQESSRYFLWKHHFNPETTVILVKE